MTRTLAVALAALGLGGALAACGKYGAPQPYPPGVEAPDDEEQRR